MNEVLQKIYIYGACGHTKVVIDAIEKESLFSIASVFDDNRLLHGTKIGNYLIVGGEEELINRINTDGIDLAIIAIGDNSARAKIRQRLDKHGFKFISVIHPAAEIGQDVTIADGCVITGGAIVNSRTKIGKNVIINSGAIVEHDCVIGDGSHIAPGATICGNVKVGECTFIGDGATIIPNIVIGNDVIVDAGSTVVRDIPDGLKVVGSPAKEICRKEHTDTRTPRIALFIYPEDPRWHSIIENTPHDFYYSPEYCCLEAKQLAASARAFYVYEDNNQFLAPLLIRDLPNNLHAPKEWHDAISPYGYSGPMLTNANDVAFLERSIKTLIEISADEGIISAFFRLHPLFPISEDCLSKYGTVSTPGKTVYVDLSLSKDELRAQIRRDHRKDIRKLRNADFHITIDNWELYDEFISKYLVNMKRVGAADYYMFSKSYFYDLKTIFGDNIHLITVISPNNQFAAGGLFIETMGLVQIHLSATADEYIKFAPTKLLVSSAIDWAKDYGHSVLHLGGGLGGRQDSLFYFKQGFSKLSADFQTFSLVFDPDKYESLSNKFAKMSGKTVKNKTGYFPNYRT